MPTRPTTPGTFFLAFGLASTLAACHGAGGGAIAPRGPADAGHDATAPDGALTASCPLTPAPLRQSGAILTLSIAPVLAGKAFVFGEPNALPSGGSVTPLNFRFYVSHVALLGAAGASVPVDLVKATGDVEPYGVHLFNAEEPASAALRVVAPPGTYTGLTFTLGLDDACNSGVPGQREPPLTDLSQLTWPHLAGYLFLRLEDQIDVGADGGTVDAGSVDAGSVDAGAVAIPTLIHMGGTPGGLLAPTITVAGALAVSAGAPTGRQLTLDVGALFAGAETAVDPASLATVLPFPEVQAGERLRQHVAQLAPFALAPAVPAP